MDSTGTLAAAGVVPTDKGAVPPRRPVFIGESLHLISHFETAVRTVHKAGEDAPVTVSGRRFPHLLFINADYGIPQLL